MNAKDAASKARTLLMDAWHAYVEGHITWSQWRRIAYLLSRKP
jgi:hypothetical protein